jgi:hypothetical protein
MSVEQKDREGFSPFACCALYTKRSNTNGHLDNRGSPCEAGPIRHSRRSDQGHDIPLPDRLL